MTYNEFMAESQESQVDIVSDQGILLAYRNKNTVMYDLYNVDDFFVEFSYNLASNEAVTMKIFEDTMEFPSKQSPATARFPANSQGAVLSTRQRLHLRNSSWPRRNV